MKIDERLLRRDKWQALGIGVAVVILAAVLNVVACWR